MTEQQGDAMNVDAAVPSPSFPASSSEAKAWGHVRGSPIGNFPSSQKSVKHAEAWQAWRQNRLPPLQFPVEGFDHVYGQNVIDEIDSHPLGTSRMDVDEKKLGEIHDYGSEKTPDDAPVGSLKDKWRLLPYFLKLRSLLRQHIDSFDHFVETEMKEIVSSPSACEIRSDHDPKFYLRYEACWVGEPSIEEESYSMLRATPFQCRLRDCTYSAPIYVNVRYTRGHQIVVKRNVIVGRMPIMLRSKNCVLRDKTDDEQVALKECCYDPGGYFIIKGVEKVILIQEQLSKNRVILEEDAKGICASITSSTHERKSKSYVLVKNGRVYLKNNTLGEDIPIVIVLKAMGIESDFELVQLVGSEPMLVNAMALSLEESSRLKILTQQQALKFIGAKIRGRTNSGVGGYRKPMPPEDEAREVLAYVVLSHVPVQNFYFRPKCLYIGHIVRRVLLVHLGKMPLDDKDYYGNKRLELAGNLLSLLFEDLFKIFNKDLKRQADLVLSKPNRAQAFDIVKCIRPDTITNGMINAIATGNWVLKRFRMDRAGVTQVLSRLSYMSALGMMTRINSQFEKTRKVSGPRSLQASQWGMLCPADTPEGEACGLVKNLALLAHITTDENDTQAIERLCRDLGVEDVNRMTGHEIHSPLAYMVFVNGLVIGVHTRPAELTRNLRHMRRQGLAGEFVSVSLNEGQRAVHIATDGGRVCRPLIIVDEASGLPKLKQMHLEALSLQVITIRDLLRQGVVEYVDCNEENNTLIALTERDLEIAIQQGLENRKMRYTHLEIDPLTILGVIGGIIPVSLRNGMSIKMNCFLLFLSPFRFLDRSFRIITRHHETLILSQWLSKQWDVLLLICMNEWMACYTVLYTRKNLW
jgi:DNA-directed RNA polymerase III subunit RPC2